MQTNNDTSETVLDSEIDLDQGADIDLDLDSEIEHEPITKKGFKTYRSKLRLLSRIHLELMDKVNAQREATFKTFFRPEDNYITETKESCDLAQLMLDSMKYANEA